MNPIVVVDYDPTWPQVFEGLRSRAWQVVGDLAVSVEHVGSTAVPGLAAKPVIDMTIVVTQRQKVPLAVERLSTLGYIHRGNLGIADREAFHSPDDDARHHLYLCPQGSAALANHLAIRDFLREHPAEARAYGSLKRALAIRFSEDIDGYIDGKTDFLLRILEAAGVDRVAIDSIGHANRKR